MSRIGVLTFLHNGNYGSSLQAYALQQVLQNMGYECEHIDYQPDVTEKALNMIRCGNSPKLLLDGSRKRRVRERQDGMQKKHQMILGFYERRMKLSPVCRNRSDLRKIAGRYDVLMCGSDQIWNPIWMNPAYLLDFAAPDQKRIAYAPSLGISVSPGRRKQAVLRRQISLFHAVSVREEEGARVLISVTGERFPVMPDPVCLLTEAEWNAVGAAPPQSAPYLLAYFIGSNPAYWERLRELSRETGLRVLVIPVTGESYEQDEFELMDGAGPEEFAGAVRGAEMLCTDSFHGLAFGTIYGKKVELIRRDRDDSRESKNSRTDHFLREVRSKGLDSMRREGLSWLKSSLE